MSGSVSYATLVDMVRTSPPDLALVLGSGLSAVAGCLQPIVSIPFADVPGLTAASVSGHKGCLTLGDWAGRRVLLFEGRLHRYEGLPWSQVMQPVHIAHRLGASIFVATNAAGGIHEALRPGHFLAIADHIDWTRLYAWRQPGPGALGQPRPSPYDQRLVRLMQEAARQASLPLQAGTYAQVTGPTYETPAEIRALQAWGADAVGMSTAREIETGVALGMECAALSCITNRAAGLQDGPIHHDDVLAAGKQFSRTTAMLLENFLYLLAKRVALPVP